MNQWKNHKVIRLETDDQTNIKFYRPHSSDFNKVPADKWGFIRYHLYILSDDEIKIGDWFYHSFAEPYIHKCLDIKEEMTSDRKVIIFENPDTPKEKYAHYTQCSNKEDCKKIIATTDTSLTIWNGDINTMTVGLPKPSDSFIKKYCEAGGIDKVMIEYEIDWKNNRCLIEEKFKDEPFGTQAYYCQKHMTNHENCRGCKCARGELILKVAPDNTITIRKVKDNWNKEEVIKFAEKYAAMVQQRNILNGHKAIHNRKWIEENL